MKKVILFFALLVMVCKAQAQNIVLNNGTWGDVYVTVYAVNTTTCSIIMDQTVTTLVSGSSSTSLNVSLPSTWASASVPTAGTYDLSYAVVSRDPLCTGSYGWGAFVGMISGSPSYYDEVTIGDAACFYSPVSYIIATFTGSTCGNFACGDTFHCDMTYPGGGTVAQIDVNW
jgi:hypothetical protein